MTSIGSSNWPSKDNCEFFQISKWRYNFAAYPGPVKECIYILWKPTRDQIDLNFKWCMCSTMNKQNFMLLSWEGGTDKSLHVHTYYPVAEPEWFLSKYTQK